MSDVKLGEIITGEAHRDAIHIAVAPVTSDETLCAGQHVGLVDGSQDRVTLKTENPIGIVDPFLKSPALPSHRFYVFLYQNTVTSMRHEWKHPLFNPGDKDVSMALINEFAKNFGMDGQELLDHVGCCLNTEWAVIVQQDSETWRDRWYEGCDEFYKHYEVVTGKNVEPEDRPTVFSCSC